MRNLETRIAKLEAEDGGENGLVIFLRSFRESELLGYREAGHNAGTHARYIKRAAGESEADLADRAAAISRRWGDPVVLAEDRAEQD